MKILNAVLNAAIVLVLIQVSLKMLEKPYKLGLRNKHGLIVSRQVAAVSVCSAAMAFYIGLNAWDKNSITDMVMSVVLVWGMGVLAVTDLKKHVVPNRFLLLLLAVWAAIIAVNFLWGFNEGLKLVLKSLAGGAMGGAIFFVCYLIVRKQLGAGDVKLAVVMGLYLTSSYAISAYLIGTILCCVTSLVLVAIKKIGWKDMVPLVPFLTIGTWITLLLV